MGILWVLIPISFVLMGLALWAFFWAVDHDQLENLDTASFEALDLPQETGEEPKQASPTKTNELEPHG